MPDQEMTVAEAMNQSNQEQAAKEAVELAGKEELSIEEKIRLANIGRRFAMEKLIGQSTYSGGLAEQYKDRLRAAGFTDEMRAALSAKRAVVSSAMAMQQAARTDAHAATRDEGGVVDETKNHLKVLEKLVPMVLRRHKITEITPADLKPQGALGRSTNKLLKHLERIRSVVARLEEVLKPHFEGKSPLEVHDQIIRRLAEADLSQESQRRALPGHGFEVLVAKGQLVELIDDLNRIGQVAFIADEKVRPQFNSDILKRVRSKRATDAVPGEPETEGELESPEEPINPDEPDPGEGESA